MTANIADLRRLIVFPLIALGILKASFVYAADAVPELSVEFEFKKKELSVMGASAAPTKDGGFVLAGELYDVSGPNTWGWLAKVSSKGNKEWQRELGKQAKNSSFHASVTTMNGDVVLAGSVHGSYGQFGSASAWLVKVNETGKVLWDKKIVMGQTTRAVDVKLVEKDKILVLVIIREGGKDSKDFISILKFDLAGNEIFRKKISIAENVFGKFIYPTLGGGFVVVGTKFSPPKFKNDVWIARFDEHATLLWDQALSDEQGDVSAGMILPDDEILLARRKGRGPLDTQLSLVKVGNSGNSVWNKKVSLPDVCGISALWTSLNGKLFASGANCDKTKARVWIGEMLENGSLTVLKRLVSVNGTDVVTVVPLDQKIAVVLEGRADSGDSVTRLLVGSYEEIKK